MRQLYILQKSGEDGIFINKKFFKEYSTARKYALHEIRIRNAKSSHSFYAKDDGGTGLFKESSPDHWTNGGQVIRIISQDISSLM